MSEKNRFRDTLNLPQTTFTMRAKSAEKEPALRAQWEELEVEKKYLKQDQTQPLFALHDGPPYANGDLHAGHALNKILKDIIVRLKRMSGHRVSYRPGWDCHGLPIEHKVTSEKQFATKAELMAACRAYATSWVERQKEQFRELGVWGEWERPYLTMNYAYEAAIMRSFGTFVGNGYIERKGKTIPWCFSCKTALATAEIEYHDRKDPSCYILFDMPVEQVAQKFPEYTDKRVSLLIWTTTPWTIPLNRAIVLHPTASYVLLDLGDNKACIVGEALADKITGLLNIEKNILATFPSQHLAGCVGQHPLVTTQQSPLIFDSSVLLEDGTACVHSAPGCGPEDYLLGLKNNLEIYSPLSSDGKYTDEIVPQDLAGTVITDGQWVVLKKLKEVDALLYKTSLNHSYPHCWRCSHGLMFRATDQWFCNLAKNDLINRSRTHLDDMTLYPAWGKQRFDSFLSNRTEWCISRQRVWGVPIPALINEETGEAHTDEKFIAAIADKVAEHGIEYWHEVSLETLRLTNTVPHSVKSTDWPHLRKETDILDVWFDSGVSHTAVMKADGFSLPVDMYLEGSDQHRGWFQSALLTSMALHDTVPTKELVTHGFVVDKDGYKMSKSRGNVIAPREVIDAFGVDVLRLWAASVDYERDVSISHDVLKQVSDMYRKIRNTNRFLLSNLYDYAQDKAIPLSQLRTLDSYAYQVTNALNGRVQKLYADYAFSSVVQEINRFCTVFLSSFYLDIVKDTLYVEAADSHARRSVQTTLAFILKVLKKVMAPLLVYTVQDIDNCMPYQVAGEEVTHLTLFEQYDADQEPQVWWQELEEMRSVLLKAIEVERAAGRIKHSLEAAITIALTPNCALMSAYRSLITTLAQHNEALVPFLEEWLIVSQVTITDKITDALSATEVAGLLVSVSEAPGVKCPRCWHWHTGEQGEQVCQRCEKHITQ